MKTSVNSLSSTSGDINPGAIVEWRYKQLQGMNGEHSMLLFKNETNLAITLKEKSK